MDMAIANLFKHKVHFQLVSEEPDYEEPHLYSIGRHYVSNIIENIESIGARSWVDLCLERLQAFFVHIVSPVVHEGHGVIDHMTITATLRQMGGDYEEHDLVGCTMDNPQHNIHLFTRCSVAQIYPFPEHMLNEPFNIGVDAYFYTTPNELRELEFLPRFGISLYERDRQILEDDERIRIYREERTRERNADVLAPLPPPDETFRQERCVICLESPPNILYFDCMHIAVCDFCDNRKRTAALRNKCDVCRATISRRIKI